MKSWGRQHKLGPEFDRRTIGTRVYWNGQEYISEVEGLEDVVFVGSDAEERAKANADDHARMQYPHDCGPATCGNWQQFADRARETPSD